MLLQCFNWITHLLNVSVRLFSFSVERGVVRQLPDDVIVDILSRLPAECVLECRRVCRRWRSLTSSQYFVKLHLTRAATQDLFLHLFHRKRDGIRELGFFVYDPTMNKGKKLKRLRRRPEIVMKQELITLFDSCGGLLLFTNWLNSCYIFVFNPVTQEQIIITCNELSGFVCGFFCRPVTNEYNILFVRTPRPKYFVYTLGSGHGWRSIKDGPLDYGPNYAPPAILNGALHWISNWNCNDEEKIPPCTCGVVVFDMNTEEFSTKPHPGKECRRRLTHKYMSLLAVKEQLLFSYWESYKEDMDIWILEEYSSWVWVQKWKLDLNLLEQPRRWDCGNDVKLVHFEDGQLVLDCIENGLFLYQVDNNTVKKLEGFPEGVNGITRHSCTLFTKSLVHPSSPPLL